MKYMNFCHLEFRNATETPGFSALYTVLLLLVALGLISCGSSKPTAKRYHLEGKVVSVDTGHGEATIDAKDIPGFMAAMAMPYEVPDSKALGQLKPGDQITADVVVADNDAHLENIVVQPPSEAAPSGAKRYHLEGTVVSVDKAKSSAVIDAKDIPGFMAAMAMPYEVPDSKALGQLKPGDQITADVVVNADEAHLENVVVTKQAGK